MSNIGRSVIILMIFPSSAVYSSPSGAQPGKAQSQTPAPTSRTRMDGTFGHCLMSPTGTIAGIVLEDGTIARFPLFEPVLQTAFLRPGDTVHVEGHGLIGPNGPIFINASVEVPNGTATRAEVTPTQSVTISSKPRSRRGQEHGLSASKGQTEDAPRPTAAPGKTQGPSRDRRTNSSLFFGSTSVSTRRKARPEGFWAKLSHITTGTGHVDSDSRWSRTQETAGP